MKSEETINDEQHRSKKKHKKRKKILTEKQNSASTEFEPEHATETVSSDHVHVSGKKKKHKKKRHNSEDDECQKETGRKQKLKDKYINTDDVHKKQKIDISEQTTQPCFGEDAVEEKKSKKKRKKEKTVITDTPVATNDITELPKKKSKKKSETQSDILEIVNNGESVPLEELESKYMNASKIKKAEKQLGTDDETSVCEGKAAKHHKRKKKHSKHREDSTLDESDSKKHKQKQKGNFDGSSKFDSQENLDEYASEEVHMHKNKNVANSNVVSHDEVNSEHISSNCFDEENSDRHKKQRKHSKSKNSSLVDKAKQSENKLKFSSGDSVESGVSQINKTVTSSDCTTTTQGQWQGNLFDSSERQNKFLRLLGGMKKSSGENGSAGEAKKELSLSDNSSKKKGLFGSLASRVSTGSASGGNTAMSATAAASLNQKLEEEYNRAMNFKLSGKVGTGFGFVKDPAEGKTFHIDVHKSRSVKFDD